MIAAPSGRRASPCVAGRADLRRERSGAEVPVVADAARGCYITCVGAPFGRPTSPPPSASPAAGSLGPATRPRRMPRTMNDATRVEALASPVETIGPARLRVSVADARLLARHCMRYRDAHDGRAWAQLATTLGLFAAVYALLLWGASTGLWAALALAAGGGPPPGAALHDPARLRPQLLLRVARRERLGGAPPERPDPDALRLLASRPRAPSRGRGRSGEPRVRRRRHADGARVPGAFAAAGAWGTGSIGTR